MWADNCYKIPAYAVEAVCCKTNLPTNTAMRAPGVVQSVMAIEAALTNIAEVLGAEPEDVRAANFYAEGDATPYGQKLTQITLVDNTTTKTKGIWSMLAENAQLATRKADVKAFNGANRWRKRGIAMTPLKYGVGYVGTMNSCNVRIYPDGTVQVRESARLTGSRLFLLSHLPASSHLHHTTQHPPTQPPPSDTRSHTREQKSDRASTPRSRRSSP